MADEYYYTDLSKSAPLTAAAAEYNLQWAVKSFEAGTLAALETAINNWLLTEPVTTGVPRWLGQIEYRIAETGANRYTALLSYAYFVAPTLA